MLDILAVFEWIFQVAILSVLAGVGIYFAYYAVVQIRHWPKVPGRIVGYEIRPSEDKPGAQKFHYPIVEFQTADGQTIKAASTMGSWREPWDIGQGVFVRYHPTDPHDFTMTNFVCVWGIPLTFLSLVAAVVAFMVYRM